MTTSEDNLYETLIDNTDLEHDIGNQIINNLYSTRDFTSICKYYDFQQFNDDICHSSSNLFIVHLNARSLQINFDDIKILLASLTIQPDVIGISETWLTSDKVLSYW